jgi:alpha-D-xyloside xylohydrolase
MGTAHAALAARIGNAWHIPDNVEPIGMMRQPPAQIFSTTNVSVFSGNQFQGSGNPGDQLEAGSTLFFKKAADSHWSSQPMTFHSVQGNNKYYQATLPANVFNAGDEVEYYLKLPYNDHLTTFLHGTDTASSATDVEAEAQAAPFSFTVQPAAQARTGNFISFDSGPLQARVFPNSGQLALAGPDLAGNPLANVITLAPPAVKINGRSLTLGPVTGSRAMANGLEVTYDLDATTVTAQITFPAEGVMRYEVVDWNGLVAQEVVLAGISDATEHFFGFGEKFDALDQSGKVVRTLTFDDPGVKGDHSYKVAPWFVSTRGYGLHLDSTAESHFDLRATQADRYAVTLLFSKLRFNLVYGPNLADVLKRFTSYSGRAFLPPPWVFGPWISSDIWRSGGEVRYAVTNFVQNFKQRGIPASAFVFDSPWETAYNDLQFNMTQFGRGDDFEGDHYDGFASLQEMMDFLQKNGLKVICWMAPFVDVQSNPENMPNRFLPSGVLETVPGQNLGKASNYDEAAHGGFFVRQSAGGPPLVVPWWKGRGSPVDFTNEAARQWFTRLMRSLIAQSQVVTKSGLREPAIGGFKTDDGETQNTSSPPNVYIPLNASYADGRTGAEMRNAYCFEYQKTVSNVLGTNGVLFARSGFVGCQSFPGHWPGDNEPNFGPNGLPSVIVAGLSAAMSAYAIWGHDIGGYQNSNFGASPADRADLFMRWTQFACFSPIMQMHRQVHPQRKQDFQAGKTEELRQYPWGYGDQALKNYQFYARLHTRLFPYIYTYAKEASTSGLPIMRPLVLLNQADANTFGVLHAYHFGNEFLVAPIVQLNSKTRQVYLPAGNWIDFWTNARHNGRQTIKWQDSDPTRFPVFVREGAIVPMLPASVQTLCDPNYVNNPGISTAGDALLFLVYPSTATSSRFTVYDGTTMQCQTNGAARSATLSSAPRPVTIQVFGNEPASITRDGQSLLKLNTPSEFDSATAGWRFDPAAGLLFIKFAHTGGSTQLLF